MIAPHGLSSKRGVEAMPSRARHLDPQTLPEDFAENFAGELKVGMRNEGGRMAIPLE
jgi:hypothetical protein